MTVFDLVAKLSLDSSEYDSGLDDAKGKASGFGAGLKKAAKIGAAAIATATTAVAGFATASVKVGAAFDSSMSQVAATMGYTVDELNTEGSEAAQTFEQLSEFAQQMGSTTAFSASQAADALNYMALAGYDAETSMTMLPNVLNLAAAGGIELAQASDMVTDAQSALGLSLDETAVLVDQMAAASSKSNTSVAQLGDAILTVGGTATYMAGGTEELAAVLGVLADNGIKGAEGGTHLRNMLLSLSSPTDDAKKTLDELGVSVFDADGNMREFAEIFPELDAAMSDLTDQEKLDAFSTIFNSRDIAAATALMSTSVERWDELTAAIEDSEGAAQNMAEVQLDNLEGDITLFQSALEGAQIAIADGLMPNIRNFVQFGSSGISRLTEAFKEGGLSGAMGALGDVLSEGLAMIIEMLPDVVSAGSELLMALVNGAIENLPLLVDAAGSILLTLATGLSENLPTLIPSIVGVILQIVESLTDPANLTAFVDAAIAIIMGLANGLIAALPQLIAAAPVIISNLVTGIVSNIPTLLQAGMDLIVALQQAIVAAIPQLLSAGQEIITTIENGVTAAWGAVIAWGSGIIAKVKEGFSSAVSQAREWGSDLINNFIDGLKQKWENLKATVSGVASTIRDFLGFSEPKEGPLSNFHTYAPDMMALFAQGIKDNEGLVRSQIESSFDFGSIGTPPALKIAAGDGAEGVDLATTIKQALQGAGVYLNGKSLVGYVDTELETKSVFARRGVSYG